ncbi:hypothetical protein SS50377_23391 [Spironucleus salmonicida]|uniref:Uncharacterized protein n=1 Tax=Spironucleus salmonicida TaxID=348837 RepID=V6LRI1_9EUKA|nr:hypothetical protein SS50377_23391 [Spironucleus salmonicida]|eukprot:EST47262.1 Hypothetical protein SS50377_12772 [Spironucleus salmonicida]
MNDKQAQHMLSMQRQLLEDQYNEIILKYKSQISQLQEQNNSLTKTMNDKNNSSLLVDLNQKLLQKLQESQYLNKSLINENSLLKSNIQDTTHSNQTSKSVNFQKSKSKKKVKNQQIQTNQPLILKNGQDCSLISNRQDIIEPCSFQKISGEQSNITRQSSNIYTVQNFINSIK